MFNTMELSLAQFDHAASRCLHSSCIDTFCDERGHYEGKA